MKKQNIVNTETNVSLTNVNFDIEVIYSYSTQDIKKKREKNDNIFGSITMELGQARLKKIK